ncbi:hypothetical protein D3C77_576570 [compost metagenome]
MHLPAIQQLITGMTDGVVATVHLGTYHPDFRTLRLIQQGLNPGWGYHLTTAVHQHQVFASCLLRCQIDQFGHRR